MEGTTRRGGARVREICSFYTSPLPLSPYPSNCHGPQPSNALILPLFPCGACINSPTPRYLGHRPYCARQKEGTIPFYCRFPLPSLPPRSYPPTSPLGCPNEPFPSFLPSFLPFLVFQAACHPPTRMCCSLCTRPGHY